jgi:hypothetical protein
MPDVLKTVFEELLVDKHAGRAAGVGAIDDDLFLGSSASRAIFRLWKWIEPGMRLARNIHSSKQLTSLKSSPPSSFFFNPSRVMVRINRSKIKSNESRWQLDVFAPWQPSISVQTGGGAREESPQSILESVDRLLRSGKCCASRPLDVRHESNQPL